MMWKKASSALALDGRAQEQSANNASDCSTQTDDNFDHPQDRVITMRIEVENATSTKQTQTNQRTPQEIANHISEHIGKKPQSDTRRNLDSFRNRTNEQGTSTNTHSYQNSRPTNKTPNEIYVSPPLPNYPPPVRPPLMITQPQLTEYRTVPTKVGQQRIHVT